MTVVIPEGTAAELRRLTQARELLFFAAINVVRKGGIMHENYQKYVNRGMPKIKALVAIARKLLGVIFALVRDHREYIGDFREGQSTVLAKEAA